MQCARRATITFAGEYSLEKCLDFYLKKANAACLVAVKVVFPMPTAYKSQQPSAWSLKKMRAPAARAACCTHRFPCISLFLLEKLVATVKSIGIGSFAFCYFLGPIRAALAVAVWFRSIPFTPSSLCQKQKINEQWEFSLALFLCPFPPDRFLRSYEDDTGRANRCGGSFFSPQKSNWNWKLKWRFTQWLGFLMTAVCVALALGFGCEQHGDLLEFDIWTSSQDFPNHTYEQSYVCMGTAFFYSCVETFWELRFLLPQILLEYLWSPVLCLPGSPVLNVHSCWKKSSPGVADALVWDAWSAKGAVCPVITLYLSILRQCWFPLTSPPYYLQPVLRACFTPIQEKTLHSVKYNCLRTKWSI